MSFEPNKSLVESARLAMAFAQKHGASDCAATATWNRNVDTSWRDGKIEKVADAISKSVALDLFVDGKFGTMSTSDLRPMALEHFVADAMALVRALAKDPNRKLPDPAFYANRSDADLEIWDASVAAITPEQRLVRLKALEDAARSGKGGDKITTVTTSVGDSTSETYRVTSNGFEAGYRDTGVWTDASVSMKDDDGRRPEDGAWASVRYAKDLPDDAGIGKEATDRTLAKLGAKKIGSGTMPIIVDARAAGGLLRHLLSPLSGSALQQKQSFFEGQLGKKVASSSFSLTDEPLLKRGLSSRPFDGEGMTAKTRPIIDKGVLKSFFLDVYYANKLAMQPTTRGGSNLVITPGHKSVSDLMKDMKNGILVTSFLGGNSNSTTGVFSLGLQGFRVVNGQKAEPVTEMNLSGKHIDFWSKLVATGNDPFVYSSLRSPSLMFDGASIAGK